MYFDSKLIKSVIILICAIMLVSCSKQELNYTNPILSGFYPDPSICRVGDDYYLVNSTFAYFPGIPVFHSNDLVNWELVGHVLDRPGQLNLDGFGVSRGIFAPSIRYNDGVFYVTCTVVDGKGNFVVTSENPAGPWSDPVWLPEVSGIDPSMYFDDDGKSYIIYNSDAPDNKPLYGGHRTIRINEIDKKNLKVISENKILVDGGVDISKKPVWIEGPHIYKVNGLYYLSAAEGGTAEDHSQVVFRSKNVMGPYESYDKNPILTQRDLDPNRINPVTSTGHADLVQTQSGDWWAVFLGCRPYKGNYFNTGRETFLAPVKWIDGWPVINPDYKEVQYSYPLPYPEISKETQNYYSGNFKLVDEFDESELNKDWIYLRTPMKKWYQLDNGKLKLELLKETCSGSSNPAFIGHRQQHLTGSASAKLKFSAQSENEKAGLVVFQNENYYYFVCKSVVDNIPVIQLLKSQKSENAGEKLKLLGEKELNNSTEPVSLKISFSGEDYSFYYSETNDEWKSIVENVDGTFLSTQTAGGFVGCIIALYATSSGDVSENQASFDWFKYEGNDKIYEDLCN